MTNLKQQLAEILSRITNHPTSFILNLFESPKDIAHGHIAFPVFFMAREKKKAPPLIAEEIAKEVGKSFSEFIESVSSVGGYVNIRLKDSWVQNHLSQQLKSQGDFFGFTPEGRGKKVVIDFSSPNVAKPMSMGHLRATVIGQALCNLARSQGYEVLALNHLGDWGVQFGKLAWAYQNWGHKYAFDDDPFEALFALYVDFHKRAEEDESLNERGSEEFRKLEKGDINTMALWSKFVDISMKEYKKIWDLLGIKFDLTRGESFYNDRLKPTEKIMEDKGILKESDGALVVDLEKEGMPPCLIRKSDGASLYATREVASALYRVEELGADINLYVVGVDQSLHFKQIFTVIEKMGYSWTNNCHHIAFGMYRFNDRKMSTRKGNVIFFRDVVHRSIEIVEGIMEKNKSSISDRHKVARQVGIGAIIFNDLSNDRIKDVDFDWDRVVDFEGDSGPYVQYCQVRCRSLIRKYGQKIPDIWPVILDSDEERILLKILSSYEETLKNSFTHFKPHILATYLIEVCRAFGHFYNKHRILNEAKDLEASRMGLVFATQRILESGLKVLNIESPEEM